MGAPAIIEWRPNRQDRTGRRLSGQYAPYWLNCGRTGRGGMTRALHPKAAESQLSKSDDGSTASQIDQQIAHWVNRLCVYRRRLADDPQFNPVKQLAFDLSRKIEAGALHLSDVASVAKELCDRALILRAEATRAYMGEINQATRDVELSGLIRESAFEQGVLIPFAAFAAKWEKPRSGVVFTGHPTFAMSKRLRDVLVRLVDHDANDEERCLSLAELKVLSHAPDPELSLNEEHAQVQEVVANAQTAVARLNGLVIAQARELYPEEWTALRPNVLHVSSWVGYDLDGRTDVRWSDTIRFRLEEKTLQLKRHLCAFERLDPSLTGVGSIKQQIRTELRVVSASRQALAVETNDPTHLSKAADGLTNKERGALRSTIAPALDVMDRLIAQAPNDDARAELALMRSRLAAEGLGTARIHIRINAVQFFNAIRKPLGLEMGADVTSRMLLRRLDAMIADVQPQTVNFASLAVERATAVRQFIAMAQILKHIDGDAPIRLLIAECEHPFTVLAALYFAKLFGVADRVDISPLFETPGALDQGARVLDALLKTSSYLDYVKTRKRICVQTGFSDAGRFVGQIPAALAIERLQGRFSRIVSRANLGDVEVLIFDTHGESMGRGCHPKGLGERFDYVMSPWVRTRFAEQNLPLCHEVSFQGGDGYVLFGSPALAYATVAELLKSERRSLAGGSADQFYEQADFSRDYFEKVKDFQQRLFENANYRMALGAFGVNLTPNVGSRKSKRQFDGGHDSRAAAAEMRAIPHNAILQQLGYLVHVVGGVGTALRHDLERFGDVYRNSDRTRLLVALVRRAKQLSSIKTLVAYSSLFDDAFWVTRPLNDMERQIKEPSLYLAALLRGDLRHDGMMHLATLLREDAVYLHDLLNHVGLKSLWPHGVGGAEIEGRVELDLLHAIRIAVIQHIYLLAARVPPFSTRHDITRMDVMNLVLSLRIGEAGELLRASFPKSTPKLDDGALHEGASYTGEDGSDYGKLNEELIDPMMAAYQTILELSVGVGHHFRAHG
jgi:phosphoenolpyruvate carboxylase